LQNQQRELKRESAVHIQIGYGEERDEVCGRSSHPAQIEAEMSIVLRGLIGLRRQDSESPTGEQEQDEMRKKKERHDHVVVLDSKGYSLELFVETVASGNEIAA
jgi:hypothetical protein